MSDEKTLPKSIEKKLAPLEWSGRVYDDGDEFHSAMCILGSYRANKIEGSWRWEWCFDEYYDEGGPIDAESLEDAKAQVWKHYTGILARAFK